VDTSVHLVTPRTHLIEPEGLQAMALGSAPGDGVHPDLGVTLSFEFPNLMPLRGLHDPWCSALDCRRESAFKGVCRLDDVVVDGYHRVPLCTDLGFGQEELGVEGGHHQSPLSGSMSRVNNRCGFR
jgi:hypothetical protein